MKRGISPASALERISSEVQKNTYAQLKTRLSRFGWVDALFRCPVSC
jgi:hypothetical protein